MSPPTDSSQPATYAAVAAAAPPPPNTSTDHTNNNNDAAHPANPSESEPLLGRPGDAVQKPNAPMIRNLWLGTGWLALAGCVILLAEIWASVFTHPTLPLVSPHPLLQSLGAVTLIQAILVLQPTGATPESKILGQRAHATLMVLALLLFVGGVSVIETNKHVNNMPHFHSAHGVLGFIGAVLFLGQYVFGVLMWAVPGVLGGEQKAKALWKYHRYSGYGLLIVLLLALLSAAETDYVHKVLGVNVWIVAAAVLLIAVGVFPRIQLRKLGIQRSQ
ncbi:cytochrome b ascorbate-dependent protein 3 [Echria macrotheca]|uniref:Cytochrome b ascorbate-dependent protein 3 n=1 Tax=Echria macrotheca TaxID=438768 RepID=A0AAJ0BN45_9PEZI|nr:cytochrome b ascorbate-dependent protein 3 [Echria macrotheca]